MSPRDHRAILIGVGLIVAGMLLLRGVPAGVRGFVALEHRAVAAVDAAERARALLAASPAVRDSLDHVLAAVVSLAPRLLVGRSAAEAGAALAGQVSLVANQQALRIVRLEPLPDSAGSVFSRAAVQVELEGDVRGLARFLAVVEAGDPLLTVPMLSVSALAPDGAPEVLRIEATISGLFLKRDSL